MSKFCPECGTAANGGKFCAECGFRFTESDATAAAPPAYASSYAPAAAAAAEAARGSFSFNYANPNANGNANANNGAANRSTFNGSFNGAGSGDRDSITTAWATPLPAPGAVASAAAAAAPAMNRAASYATNKAPYTQPPPPPPPASTPAQPAAGQWRQTPHQSPSVPPPPAYTYASANTAPGSDPLLQKPPAYLTATPAPEPVPSAAAGPEAQEVYEKCVTTMRASRGGANEDGVKAFKQNCRLYGLKQMDVVSFYDSIVRELGPEATLGFVPQLARLVPDDDRRRELIEYNASKRPTATMASPHAGNAQFLSRDSSSSNGSFRDRTSSYSNGNGAAAPASKGILKGRYADHPNCDICHVAFDVSKRRHQCRYCGLAVCSSCSPLRLLIPPGKEIEGAKGYVPSDPQRVCIQCAPQLHQFQDELVAQYAKANEDNIYEARGRLVRVPYSNSLFKECQNAADIIGNFFRDDWAASADRAIPVAFLQKAHGLAIMTILKAGFLVTGQIGTGLVVAKLPDGTWSAPSAIGVGGLGGGFEIGGELIELMIILGSEGAVKVFHKPQANVGAGLDLAVGPYGRSAVAAAAVSASGLNANYSYSQSKGFFAGISLQGKVIVPRNDLNRKFYGRDLQPGEILSGHIAAPNAARPLYEAIQNAMQGVEIHRESVARRASIMGPCRLCNCPMFVAHTHQVWNKNCKTCKHVH